MGIYCSVDNLILRITYIIFSPERANERRDPGDDVKIVHQVTHVLSKIFSLTVVLTSGCWAAADVSAGNDVITDSDAAQCQAGQSKVVRGHATCQA